MAAITDVVDLEKQGEIAIVAIDNPPVNALSDSVLKDGSASSSSNGEYLSLEKFRLMISWILSLSPGFFRSGFSTFFSSHS